MALFPLYISLTTIKRSSKENGTHVKGSAEPCHNRHMRIFDMDVCVCVSKNVRPSCVKSSNEKSGATHITHCLQLLCYRLM